MSDSDDTDVLLLIPPDLFLVHSSDSEDSLKNSLDRKSKSIIVSEIIEHIQSLESRISAIEYKDSPTNSINEQLFLDSMMNGRQTFPRTKFSTTDNMQSTFRKDSLQSTPNIHRETYSSSGLNDNQLKSSAKKKANSLTKTPFSQTTLQSTSSLHGGYVPKRSLQFPTSRACEDNVESSDSSSVHNRLPEQIHKSETINLHDEVNNLLERIESRNGSFTSRTSLPLSCDKQSHLKNDTDRKKAIDQKLKMSNGKIFDLPHQTDYNLKENFHTSTLIENIPFSAYNNEKFISEIKAWTPCELNESKISITPQLRNYDEIDSFNYNQQQTEKNQIFQSAMDRPLFSASSHLTRFPDEFTKSQTITSSTALADQNMLTANSKSCPSILKYPNNTSPINLDDRTNHKTDYPSESNIPEQNTNEIEKTKSSQRQHLLVLSDFWNLDKNKPLEEQLKLKLEEERFRREHCEALIQELQKQLLEQQEKLAVALRVDDEKNLFFSQFQASWKKMKHKVYELELDRENLRKILKDALTKHQSDLTDCQEQIRQYKEELSKALNLAGGYKESSDSLLEEKVNLLKNHAEELQSYKKLAQQAEHKYEEMKDELQKLLARNQDMDMHLKIVQQNLSEELQKNNKVKIELDEIHKALDTCEAELAILRQEKENLQLKLKEEANRINILEQTKSSLINSVEEAKNAEKIAESKAEELIEQQDKLRSELRGVYQKQVDELVKTKLQEFQTQLDTAETVFKNEIETKQRAIAECAARKIKDVIDKHKLEMDLVEAKHKEEKKLFEIKLAQSTQKSILLEAQLNSYQKNKNQLVEQLHTMLQKQWQQALSIISEGNKDGLTSFQQINVERFLDPSIENNVEIISNHSRKFLSDPAKLDSQKKNELDEPQNENMVSLLPNTDTPLSSRKDTKDDLKKYMKMILDIQQKNDDFKPKIFNRSPPSSEKDFINRHSIAKYEKDHNTSTEANSTWQPISEASAHDTSEYLNVPQNFQQKQQKRPWK